MSSYLILDFNLFYSFQNTSLQKIQDTNNGIVHGKQLKQYSLYSAFCEVNKVFT